MSISIPPVSPLPSAHVRERFSQAPTAVRCPTQPFPSKCIIFFYYFPLFILLSLDDGRYDTAAPIYVCLVKVLEHFFAKYSLESPLRQYLLQQKDRVKAEKDAVDRELAPTLQLKDNLDKQVRRTV